MSAPDSIISGSPRIGPGQSLIVDGYDWSWTFVVYRKIIDWPGYEFGSDGTVWSRRRRRWGGIDGPLRQRKGCVTNNGYVQVCLCDADGARSTILVHRLILTAFFGPRSSDYQCRHLNGDRTDNNIRNLAWGTAKENKKDQTIHGTLCCGERHHRSKLTDVDVREIRHLHKVGVPARMIAAQFSVDKNTIWRIVSRKNWAHIV